MKSGLSFLVAALRCEIAELDQLARTSELATLVGRLVHALQRERGLSNLMLASEGTQFVAERECQIEASLLAEQAVRERIDQLETGPGRPGNGARLFSRVAWVLPGLDALPMLRDRIRARRLAPAAATAAFVKLIAGLLAVVFEAADGATDPEVSRLLVAMFNFMQGKEFAGQERACGAAAFAAGRNDLARQQQWLHLIDSQERCFGTFEQFSSSKPLAAWRGGTSLVELATLERLRRVACAAPAGAVLDKALSRTWFDACSLRIDAMQRIEAGLAGELRERCDRKIEEARAELGSREALLASLPEDRAAADAAFFDAPDPAAAPGAAASGAAALVAPYGHRLERSILEMVQDQSMRLQAMSDELQTVRVALNERKLIERAKGVLMAHRRVDEGEAHRMLRETAMNQNRRLVEVAESVLSMADYLPASAPR
ncbi:MAG: ANTAR domain-containing protein [Comamonadaceae bacterium]|nr:MAG: ANTAR domain-containing protein [Comamonadaceae bacterium]